MPLSGLKHPRPEQRHRHTADDRRKVIDCAENAHPGQLARHQQGAAQRDEDNQRHAERCKYDRDPQRDEKNRVFDHLLIVRQADKCRLIEEAPFGEAQHQRRDQRPGSEDQEANEPGRNIEIPLDRFALSRI